MPAGHSCQSFKIKISAVRKFLLMFIHLNTHSNYSAMRGTASIDQLLQRAKQYKQKAMALTEVNSLRNFIHFVQKANYAGIFPIAGVNVITPNFDLILLSENQIGYQNICHIITNVKADKTISLKKLLENQNTGIFILSHKEKNLRELRKFIPATHLYVELRYGTSESEMREIAKNLKLELVATGDVYFLDKREHLTHKILRAIEKNMTLSALNPKNYKDEKHYFQHEADIQKIFPNSQEAIDNSYYLAKRCKTDWNFVDTIFPGLSLKDNDRANKKLRKLVYTGAQKRYPEITTAIKERIEYELTIITQKGFAPYFLVVSDIVKNANTATIGRGSAAASIVSFCLFITQVDPIKYNLIFERFIHPERVDMPDIDIDFPWDERDKVLNYVFEKYGEQRTAMVASQVFIQPRSGIRETGKVYGLSNEEIKAITKRVGFMNSAYLPK